MGCRIVSCTNCAKYGSGRFTLRFLAESFTGVATASVYSWSVIHRYLSMSCRTTLRCLSAVSGLRMGS